MNKKRIFSGVQPSGELHIGNYLGAIKNWVGLQDEFESMFCIVDLHAITVPQDPESLRRRTLEVAKMYLAAGVDPEKSIIYVQSHVKEHSELAWILNTITQASELTKMTQFKDKSGIVDEKSRLEECVKLANKAVVEAEKLSRNVDTYFKGSGKAIDDLLNFIYSKKFDNTGESKKLVYEELFRVMDSSKPLIENLFKLVEKHEKYEQSLLKRSEDFLKLGNTAVGLFDYPVLMAADILLFDTEVVPVGEDQVQHVELTRTLGRRFNKKFGDTFVVPKVRLQKETMRIMGLDDPTKKMSKSAASEYNFISLLESPESIEKKIKKAVTDSGSDITYSEERPALKNLIDIYSGFSGKSPEEVVAEYEGKGFGDFKKGLTEVVLGFIIPFQERYGSLKDEEVIELLEKNAKKVSVLAEKKMKEVKEKVGFLA